MATPYVHRCVAITKPSVEHARGPMWNGFYHVDISEQVCDALARAPKIRGRTGVGSTVCALMAQELKRFTHSRTVRARAVSEHD